MPDESDFRQYKTLGEFMKTSKGSKYYHDLLMRATSHPIRREILNTINKSYKISYHDLFSALKTKNILDDINVFKYNLDYLIKALCINVIKDGTNNQIYYEITQAGQVVDWI